MDRPHSDMDKQDLDRCESEELDPALPFLIKTSHTHSPSDHNTAHTPDSQGADISVLNLHVRLFNLRRKNQELLYINKKWAEEYSKIRQHSERQVSELKRRLKNHEQITEVKEKKMEDYSFLPNATKESTQEIELKSRIQEADTETERLRMQCDNLRSRGQQQEQEIKRLNKALQRAYKTLAMQQESQETEENIWRHQVQVYKEDLIKEKRDRNKLKEKCAELEKKFKKLHTELHLYKTQVWWT